MDSLKHLFLHFLIHSILIYNMGEFSQFPQLTRQHGRRSIRTGTTNLKSCRNRVEVAALGTLKFALNGFIQLQIENTIKSYYFIFN